MYYNESYDDYIRSILGYPNLNNNQNTYNNSMEDTYYTSKKSRSELEDMYPEIYKIVYPMINKRCYEIREPLTRELLDNITEEIYSVIEANNEINLNISLNNQTKLNRNETKQELKQTQIKEQNREETRQLFNRDLKDLIKILLIRELIGRPTIGPKPPMRPPFPGPGPRPPIIPREYPYDLYEQH